MTFRVCHFEGAVGRAYMLLRQALTRRLASGVSYEQSWVRSQVETTLGYTNKIEEPSKTEKNVGDIFLVF